MKLKNMIIAAMLGALLLGSCNYLEKEPDTELTMDMVFDNREKVKQWLAYAYSGIPNPGEQWLKSHGWEIFADDLTPSDGWKVFDWPNIYKILGNWTVNTTWDGAYWSELPKRIRQAYILIDNVKALPEQEFPQSEVDIMKAECRFLAAYYYWMLANTYGGIPFKPNYITPSDYDLSDLMVGQTPFDVVVEWLDKELLEVSKLLPATRQPSDYGRATSVMCHTVRSKMLLFAASPLVNGNEAYTGYVNYEGKEIFNTTYDADKWVKAAEACKLAIEAAEAAGHKLFTVASTVNPGQHDPFISLQTMFWTTYRQGNTEILFPYTKNHSDGDRDGNFKFYETKAITLKYGGGGGLGVYQGLVDAFFMSNGLPATPENGYVETGFTAAPEIRPTSWNGGNGVPGVVTPAGIYNMYAKREPRFYTTVSYHGSWYALDNRPYNFFYTGNGGGDTSDNYHNWDAPMNGYLVRKKVHPQTSPKDGISFNRDVWLYRLAGTYLDYAEAVNEAYDTGEARLQAIEYLNRVRYRAGVREYTFDPVLADDPNYIQIQNDQSEVRKLVRMERRVELCAEGTRWDDIRRWKIAGELPEVTGAGYGMNRLGTDAASFFQRKSHQTRVWKDAYYWMPVYIDEYKKNPNLVQAPFWN